MIAMGGRRKKIPSDDDRGRVNQPTKPAQDKDGIYLKACAQFSEELGFELEQVWWHWCQLAFMHELESKLPRAIAEERAFHDLQVLLDKRGSEPS